MTPREVRERLQKDLSKGRFLHTMSVARWARALARRHGADPERAWLAGLLHDCAKEMPGLRLSTIAQRHRLPVPVPGKSFILKSRRFGLLHAYVSAWAARRFYDVSDAAVLSAVAKHTLGAPRMTVLDKVLYVADFSAPQRGYEAAARVRRLARENLDAAYREAQRLKLFHVISRGGALHPQAVRLWNEGFGARHA